MRERKNPSMVVKYVRCNYSPDQFCMVDWTSNEADVLWVALLLDHLPSKILTKSNISASKEILHGNDLKGRYFLLNVPFKELFEFEKINQSPFLPSTGLNDLNIHLKGNWKSLSFRFEFPVDTKPLFSLKGGIKW